jgi:Protein of unknown function (DUF2844)
MFLTSNGGTKRPQARSADEGVPSEVSARKPKEIVIGAERRPKKISSVAQDSFWDDAIMLPAESRTSHKMTVLLWDAGAEVSTMTCFCERPRGRFAEFLCKEDRDLPAAIAVPARGRKGFTLRCALLGASLVLACRDAQAALGEDTASVIADSQRMNGARSSKATERYIAHEIRIASDIVVREYVGAEGKVFAVTWRGPRLPDMRQLLGAYFETYREATRVKRARHGPFVIDEPGLIVHSNRHLRSFFGEAHLPAAVPAFVRPLELP